MVSIFASRGDMKLKTNISYNVVIIKLTQLGAKYITKKVLLVLDV